MFFARRKLRLGQEASWPLFPPLWEKGARRWPLKTSTESRARRGPKQAPCPEAKYCGHNADPGAL